MLYCLIHVHFRGLLLYVFAYVLRHVAWTLLLRPCTSYFTLKYMVVNALMGNDIFMHYHPSAAYLISSLFNSFWRNVLITVTMPVIFLIRARALFWSCFLVLSKCWRYMDTMLLSILIYIYMCGLQLSWNFEVNFSRSEIPGGENNIFCYIILD